MKTQIATAKTMDQEEERAMKKRGLLLGAHVPQSASQLDLAKATMSSKGHFSESLVTANDLLEANRVELAVRSGNYEKAGLKTRATAVLQTGVPGHRSRAERNSWFLDARREAAFRFHLAQW